MHELFSVKPVPGAAIALLLLLGGCAREQPEPYPEEDRLFEKLMEEYVSERFRFYPVESTVAGLPGNDAVLGSFSRDDVGSRIGWLSDFHGKLMGVEWKALSRPAYLDALWLTSLVKAELFDLEKRRIWERSASFYGEIVRLGLVSLLMTPDLPDRTEELAGRLAAVSAILDQAQQNLVPSGEWFRTDGLRSLELCRTLLAEMPLLLEERLPAYRIAELSEQSRVATRAVQALEARLAEAPPVPEAASRARLGAEDLKLYFLHHEMVDWEPDRLRRAAEEALSTTTAEITELALERIPPPSAPVAASGDPAPDSGLDAQVARLESRVREFLSGMPGAPDGAVPVRLVPDAFIHPDPLRLWRPASLDPIRGASLLVSSSAPVDPVALELHTLSELAGSYRLYGAQSQSASLLRRVFRSPAMSEGWRSWYVARLLERGYAEDAGGYELELRALRRARLDELRLAIVVGLHAEGMSREEAERRFRDEGGLSPEAAAREAVAAGVDPSVATPGLGRVLLGELTRDYFRENPLATAEELDAALLAEGLLPARLLRFELLGPGD